jgi:glycolate oxidase
MKIILVMMLKDYYGYDLISKFTTEEILYATDNTEKARLWKYRKKIGEAAINYSLFKDIDVVVPRSKASLLYNAINLICSEFNFELVVVGHIGDGNFHINIFKNDDENWDQNIEKCLKQVFQIVNKYEGTISGEHGIGTIYNIYLDTVMSQYQIDILKQIKNVFDPKNLINSNVIF